MGFEVKRGEAEEDMASFRVTLSSEAAHSALRFDEVRTRSGEQFIVVSAVAYDSEAQQEGVRPGQRLLALSDPIRGAEMWPITPSTSSLSRVRDAFKLRRAPTVDLVLSAESVETQLEGYGRGPSAIPAPMGAGSLAEEVDRAAGGNGAGPAAQSAPCSNGAGAGAGDWRGAAGADSLSTAAALGSPLLPSSGDAPPAIDTGAAPAGASAPGSVETIAEKLEARQAAAASEAARAAQAYDRRVQRRREYMERDSVRSDSKLFVGLFVAFVAPAAGILAWAFFSGYLDQLAQGYKRF
ncbi:hypothetical protein WJX81_001856 [Elliptochloris bilobata]|uniref:PDZ domain-containing protein n=1 Tax=Elliptochloris bilobata TaxID=381761 RepID=A0AAW1RDU9_9CHLO